MLPALGYSLASFASDVMGCVLHGDFTLQRTITPAVLDVQMHLTLSFMTQSLVERLCDFKIYAISVLSFIGSV